MMLNVLKGLVKSTVGVVTLPIDVAADVLTLGGSMVDRDSFTAKKIGKIMDGIDEATD